MNRLTRATLLATGLAIAAPACGGEAPSTEPISQNLSETCELVTGFTSADRNGSTYTPLSLYDTTMDDLKLAQEYAVDGDLEEAVARYEAEARDFATDSENLSYTEEGDSVSYTKYEASRIGKALFTFLADPEVAQKGIQAECYAYDENFEKAEKLLVQIPQEQRKSYEDKVEVWAAFHSEQLAKDDQLTEAYELTESIDDEGSTTKIEARDNVEHWASFYAEQLAKDGQVDEAFNITNDVDKLGEVTNAEARDDVEFWASFYAEQLAKNADSRSALLKALEAVDKIDDKGLVVNTDERDAVEYWLEFHAEKAVRDGDYSEAKNIAELADDKGEITKESILSEI